MIVDILTPLHGSASPHFAASISNVIEFSRCHCAMIEMQKQFENAEYKPSFHPASACPAGKSDVQMPPLASMSIVHWARNTLIMKMRPSADYAFFTDADMTMEPDTLDRMLAHGKDIVTALCTRRTDPAIPTIRSWMEEEQNFGELLMWDEKEPFFEVDANGTGVMLLSRRVLEDVAEAYHPEQYQRTGNGFWFENLRFPHLDAECGEDISLCVKASRLGYKIWVDTSIQPLHWDFFGYSYTDYLSFRDEKIAEVKAAITAKAEKERNQTEEVYYNHFKPDHSRCYRTL